MRVLSAAGGVFLCLAGVASAQNAPAASAAAPAGSGDAKASAYYHYSLGHLYSELAGAFGNRGDYFTKAVDNYREAMKEDPGATFIAEELSDLYIQSGRLRDAVVEAEGILKQNPNDINARRILARIYSRLIGESQQNRIDETMLKKAIEQYEKITELDPSDTESWVMLGKLDKVAQNSPEAERALKAALKLDPDNEDALTLLAMVYTDMGQTKQATDLLRKVTEHDPSPSSFATLAEAYEQMREYALAAETLKKAVELAPENADLKRGLAQDLIEAEQYDAALKIYADLVAADPKDVKSELQISQIYRQQHQYAKAEEASAKAHQMDPSPDNIDVRYNDVSLLVAQNKLPEAIALLKQILADTEKTSYADAQRQGRASLLDRLGTLYRTNEQYAEAVGAWQELAQLDPDLAPRTVADIVETWEAAKEYGKAEQAADSALTKYPSDRAIQAEHALLEADLGHYEQAMAEAKKMLAAKEDRETWMTLAQVEERGKDFTEMAKALDQAEKLSASREDRENIFFLRGAMYERLKKYDAAEAEFRKALELDPDNAQALNYLGYMFADQDMRLPEAEQLVSKALDQEPYNGAYLDSLGWVYFKMNKLPEAEEQLRRALQKLSRDPTVHDHLGDVYYHEGKIRDAMLQWQNSLKEWQTSAPSDVDKEELAKVQKKLEGARVRLAREGHGPIHQ